MRRRRIIAMDGPAGVGKSTVGRLVAERLGYHFINTGEMYRALTWKALEEGVDLSDAGRVAALARRVKWEFKPTDEGATLRTFLDGEGVSSRIREERVSRNSSLVAGIPAVRRRFRLLQRRLGKDGGVVMEGRDITTNVFPDADVKVYLDASLDERAARRHRQLSAAGKRVSLERIREDILARDRKDMERRINPLRQAEGALVIDSTRMNMHEVAEAILRRIRGLGKRGATRALGRMPRNGTRGREEVLRSGRPCREYRGRDGGRGKRLRRRPRSAYRSEGGGPR